MTREETIMYSLLLKNGRVVDPLYGVDGKLDIAIEGSEISVVGEDLDPSEALNTLDLGEQAVIPGIIDPHVHLTERLGGHEGFYMLARAGVTTAVDFAGPVSEIRECFQKEACGLNIAVLEALIPGDNLSGEDPSSRELEEVVIRSLEEGGLGIKIMGGHYPLTPQATRRCVEVSDSCMSYITIHAGTTRKGSNLEGALEALEIIGNEPAHLAHINSYCRGSIKPALEEVLDLLSRLEKMRNVQSGSYLAMVNGTSGKCIDGIPESLITRKCLEMGGFEGTSEGLGKAILTGFAGVSTRKGRGNVLLYGEEGLQTWRKDDNIPISFPVNSPQAIFLCATAKRDDGTFIVPALCSDGGAIARNCILERGLSLVNMQYLSLHDLVIKTSVNPARMFGFTTKGSLSPGMDADITVLDMDNCRASLAVARGKVIMKDGEVVGSGGTMIISEKASSRLKGTHFQRIDLSKSQLYSNSDL